MTTNAKKKSNSLIFLCWLMYTVAYLGRYSYTTNVTLVESYFGISHADSGLVTTFFFFAYGVGQVIHGLLCKRYNKRVVLSLALLVSALLNLAVFCDVPFFLWKYLWLLNGIAQATLWPTAICMLAENLEEQELKKAVVVMSTTPPVGTALTYGVSALFSLTDTYKYAFLFATVTMAVVGVVWFVSCKKVTNPQKDIATDEPLPEKPEQKRLSASLVFFVIVICVFSAITNLVKDGLSNWMPTILKEKYLLTDSLSILFSIVLPLCGVLGAILVTALHKKVGDFLSLLGIVFTIAVICLLGVLGLLQTSWWVLVLLLFTVVVVMAYGSNSIITSMIPMYMRDKMNSGKLAGILNGCAYVGSTISAYGLGLVADNGGWNDVFTLLLVVCCIPPLYVAISIVVKAIKNKKKN